MSERLESIFNGARMLPKEERDAYLKASCKDDKALLEKVERFLAMEDEGSDFLKSVDTDPTVTLAGGSAVKTGETIGRYKLLQPIGEGGFGVVYMAEQEQPVRRRVALKVIKAGMDTKQVIARFEAERQALALMDHPNIARVLDAGATDNGRPYFVMELVKGIPITDYCNQTELGTQQRLELFREVCLAVQHAHHKGIIHRDLKPSNIMVTLRDDKPVVKIIDFGIAKATEQRLTEKTLFTHFGQMIGTPAYMSPEQAAMSEFDVDTRSDVYSLGVLLYELLTGTTPFDAKSLHSAGFDEMRRMIREDQPPYPSTKLSTLDKEAKLAIANKRHATPDILSKQIHGELDLIVMKALEKNRSRRYESASALAQDIQRHLNDEPISAVAPSVSYKLRRFARRNKGPVTVAAVIALMLVGGIIASSWQAVRATRAEALALTEADRATAAAVREKQANEQAQKRLKQIEKGNEIITSIFRDLDIARVEKGNRPLEAVLAERLVQAADQLDEDSVGDPMEVAQLQHRLGMSLYSLGFPEDAIKLFERAYDTFSAEFGDNDPTTLASMGSLAAAYSLAGQPHRAIPLLEQALNLQKSHLGEDHPDTTSTTNSLARAYMDVGQLDRALPLWEHIVKLSQELRGLEDPKTITYMSNLALGYRRDGQLDRAISLFEQTLELQKKVMGEDHPYTLTGMDTLATAYMSAGRMDLALPLFEQTLRSKYVELGGDHPSTIATMHNYAQALRTIGQMERAIGLLEITLERCKVMLGDEHPDTLSTQRSLALTYQDAGQLDRTLPMLEQALEGYKAKLGVDHPYTIATMRELAKAYEEAGQPERAESLNEQTLQIENTRS